MKELDRIIKILQKKFPKHKYLNALKDDVSQYYWGCERFLIVVTNIKENQFKSLQDYFYNKLCYELIEQEKDLPLLLVLQDN